MFILMEETTFLKGKLFIEDQYTNRYGWYEELQGIVCQLCKYIL